ncbi:MAG: N-6 DNA methylase [Candidatus Bipolaricaulota bacterium]|nr:N-6 DNA methylase [Candidatus Bipolaricaulota bacterium]MCS7274313.1 N-6 DNA methylase [Candidatus Bipolaricaulota bacterium]MDW8111436.1 N-6 DNA methylase [Candidatus Bipolaricaulota bacterium]
MPRARVTERSFYPVLIKIIEEAGGSGVQEILFDSVPDILFDLGGHRWLLSVKIGEDAKTVKEAFLQYLRHKEESGIRVGLVLLLPEAVKRVQPTEEALRTALDSLPVTALIDAGLVKEELKDRPFVRVLDLLKSDVLQKLERHQATYYPLARVISLLQQQVTEIMSEIDLGERDLLRIITDRKLLMDLGHLEQQHAEAVARFLAAYIFLSQILFLRLLATARPDDVSIRPDSVSHYRLRQAFQQIVEQINYRPIYELDVLDNINEKFLKDTFDLIWGLEIERVRYELPGRIFHELMPTEIRKLLAAFYTRPQAADLLAHLTIQTSDDTILDPACGSGTILTAGYRRKAELFAVEGKAGNPHRRFCEQEIFGADIMPFAVHLASANLAAMEPGTTIARTQIIQRDSLQLEPDGYPAGVQLSLFREAVTARTTKGDPYLVRLAPMDCVLMNPPFTKIERGIRRFIDLRRFYQYCGGEVGLWGHFVMLADIFLKAEKGIFGAVLPINVLRGRESEKVRRKLFEEWTPLYILKPTRNYGFSEWAEYRDVLFIARKKKPAPNHRVRFVLVKKDLTRLTSDDVADMAERIKNKSMLRSPDLDIDSHSLQEIKQRFMNLMWFCGGTDFRHRDSIIEFLDKFSGRLRSFPDDYFREGYRPVPKGVSRFLFLTRHTDDARIEQAFLRFVEESTRSITAYSPLGASYKIERESVIPSLRTTVGLKSMDITGAWDYIAYRPYQELERVCRASGRRPPRGFWKNIHQELQAVSTHFVVSRRINPFSPSTYLSAFLSQSALAPSNQVNVIAEDNLERARAVCALLNSALFFANFFLLKEESTGRYIDIRFYDLYEMNLFPPDSLIKPLAQVFEKYATKPFPPLRNQFDQSFDQRYEAFWDRERRGRIHTRSVWEQPVKPAAVRLKLDLDVCQALGVPITRDDLIQLYEIFVKEMILVRGLTRD